MRFIFATVMLVHGVSHLAGFLGSWAPTRTTIFGSWIDLGSSWIKLVGIGWLLIGLAFGATAVVTGIGVAGWPTVALVIAGSSLALCILQLPETKIGVALNAALIVALIVARHDGWF